MARRNYSLRSILEQFLRAGTGIGSNLEESEAAQSKADFIAKCRIALKEARETVYWSRIFIACEVAPEARLKPLLDESREIVAIVTTIVRRASMSKTR